VWISNECFVFTTPKGAINYLVTGIGSPKVLKLSNADKKYFIMGYDGKQQGGRLYMIDKALNIVSYSLQLSLVNFQAAILSDDIHGAQAYLSEVPAAQHSKLAKFLEANNQLEYAFEVTPDKDHKFDLALALNKVEEAFRIAEEQGNVDKWKKVGDIALMQGQFHLAERCFDKSSDYNSQLLFYTSCGDLENLQRVAANAEANGKFNVAFQAAYLTGDADRCLNILLKSKRISEAAFFARAYCPSKLEHVVKIWDETLKARKLPFSPENIANTQSHIINQSLIIEKKIKNMLHT